MNWNTWEEFQIEWEQAYNERRSLLDEVALTRPKHYEKSSAKHKSQLRALWTADARTLHLLVYCHYKFGRVPTPFPADLVLNLSNMCESLGGGTIPRTVKDAKADGGRPMLPNERNDIARAVHFLEAVEEGVVACRSPVQTVATCFNVTKQAVRNWKKRRDEICWGIERAHPNVIEEAMRNCGKRYSVIGRGAPSR